ncbi:MAG: hypothetical protein Q9M13_04385 [Mariprofundales bacterium]|nr:hypothetical protein [Mariprofundales bacterium]
MNAVMHTTTLPLRHAGLNPASIFPLRHAGPDPASIFQLTATHREMDCGSSPQ